MTTSNRLKSTKILSKLILTRPILNKLGFLVIGIFDSGIGGLTVLRELLSAVPAADYVYLGDTARTPYGSKGRETVVRYSKECAGFLLSKEIEILIVACNTASSLALDSLKVDCQYPIIGTIDSASRLAVSSTKSKRVAVIGTEATISSGAYEAVLKGYDAELTIFSKACPLFVPLVEQGMFDGEIVDRVVELYLKDLQGQGIDTLILGCTHYPMLKSAIARFLGTEVEIVECSKAIAEEVKSLLSQKNAELNNVVGDRSYYVTDGVSRFNHLAALFLDQKDISAQKVELSH